MEYLEKNKIITIALVNTVKDKIKNSTFAHKPKLFFSVNPEHVNNLF